MQRAESRARSRSKKTQRSRVTSARSGPHSPSAVSPTSLLPRQECGKSTRHISRSEKTTLPLPPTPPLPPFSGSIAFSKPDFRSAARGDVRRRLEDQPPYLAAGMRVPGAGRGRAGCPQPAAVEAHDPRSRNSPLNGNEFCEPLYIAPRPAPPPRAVLNARVCDLTGGGSGFAGVCDLLRARRPALLGASSFAGWWDARRR